MKLDWRGPSSRSAAIVLGVFGVLSLGGLPDRFGVAAPTVTFLLEAPMLVCGGLLCVRATAAALGGAPSASQPLRVATVLLLLIGGGQLVKQKRVYPLVPFQMYGAAKEEAAVYYEYEAIHPSGRRDKFRPSTVIPTLGFARVVRGLAKRLDELEAPAKGALSPEPALAVQTLQTLLRRHNATDGADRVAAIDVYRVRLQPPFTADAIQRTRLLRVEAP